MHRTRRLLLTALLILAQTWITSCVSPSSGEANRTSASKPSPDLPAASVAPVATPAGGWPGQILSTTQSASSPFSADAAMKEVVVLSRDIGSRAAGEPGAEMAAGYISRQLQSWGYQVERQTFPFTYFVDHGSRLSMVEPEEVGFVANTLMYSASGDVTAPLVNAGLGRAGDFDGADVKGKIALVKRGEITFSEKEVNAAKAGAVGIIIYNHSVDNFRASLAGRGNIPAVSISGQDGARLLASILRGPVKAKLAVDALVERRDTENVVARLPEAAAARTVVVGAHYDSVSAGPGANDNASGTATMLELARAMATGQRKYAVVFVAFGAEEVGLLGSKHFVSTLSPEERRRVAGMVNLDMVGVGDEWQFNGNAALVSEATTLAKESGLRTSIPSQSLDNDSDHASFTQAGIPAIFLYLSNDPRYHTAEDKAEYVAPANLGAAGRLAIGLVEYLGQGEALPDG